jgi:hypothetical protein
VDEASPAADPSEAASTGTDASASTAKRREIPRIVCVMSFSPQIRVGKAAVLTLWLGC